MHTKKQIREGTRENGNGANKLDLRNEIQEQHGARREPWFAWVFDALRLPKAGEVLDLGCGTGSLWAENAGRIPRGLRVAMADISFSMLQEARLSDDLQRARPRILAASSQGIPFPGEQFDMVTAVGVLDLVPDLPKAMEEIRRVLRPAGKFVATAGGKGHLQELENLLTPYLPAERARSLGGNEGRFGMENGQEALSPYFKNISRSEFHDRMVFHDVQPVLNYVLSEQAVVDALTLEQLGDLILRIKRRLAKNGSFDVTIHKGLFAGQKT